MRVLHVINSLILAGAEALTKELALECKRHGVDVSVAVLKRLDNAFEDELFRAGVPLISLSSTGIYSPLHILPLARKISDYDVVQATLFPATLWTICATRIYRRVPIITTSEQSTHNRRRTPCLRPFDRWLYPQFDAIPCASRAIESSLLEWVPAVADRTLVIPNAIPLEKFRGATPARKEEIIGTKAPVAIFVARFENSKDHTTLLRAVTGIIGLHLVLVGDGPLRPAAEALAQSLNIAQRVHFIGRRSDVPALLKMADVYVQCSTWEGFGIAAVEAMAAGLPVIATDVPGLAEVIGDSGILFERGDVGALQRHLNAVLSDAGLRHRLVTSGQQRAEEFSIQRTAALYLDTYESLLRKKSAAGSARR